MKRLYTLLLALLLGLGGALAAAPAAQAHHAQGQNLYVRLASVVPRMEFSRPGSTFWVSRGGSNCCPADAGFHVGPAHDIIVTSREYPGWSVCYDRTNWYFVPRLANPGHMSFNVQPNFTC